MVTGTLIAAHLVDEAIDAGFKLVSAETVGRDFIYLSFTTRKMVHQYAPKMGRRSIQTPEDLNTAIMLYKTNREAFALFMQDFYTE